MIEVQREVRSGVPVFWHPGHGEQVSGALLFRAGRADERLPRHGLTHLVEHLALFGVEDGSPIPVNGFVDLLRCVFYASGTREEVAGFLTAVCRSLADLPLDRLEAERGVLRAESEGDDGGFLGRVLGWWFGPRAHGLGDCRELAIDHATADEVAAHAAACFTAGNAVAWMTAEPPADLELALPEGPRRPPPEVRPIPELLLPGYVVDGTGGVCTISLAEGGPVLDALLHVARLRARVTLRRERGLSYSVKGWREELGATEVLAVLSADCPDDRAHEVCDDLLTVLEDLAHDGPSAEELEGFAADEVQALEDAEPGDELDRVATDELLGRPARAAAEVADAARAVTAEEVARATRALIDRTVVLVPDDAERPPEGERLRPLFGHVAAPVEGRVHRRPRSGPLRRRGNGDHLVAGEEGLTWWTEDADPLTVRFDRCELVTRHADHLELAGDDTTWIAVRRDTIEGYDEIVAAVERGVPRERWVDAGDLVHHERVQALTKDMRWRFAVKDELLALPGLLARDEELLHVVHAETRIKVGVLAVTDRRSLFLHDISSLSVTELAHGDVEDVALDGRHLRLAGGGAEHRWKLGPAEVAPEVCATIDACRAEAAAREPARRRFF